MIYTVSTGLFEGWRQALQPPLDAPQGLSPTWWSVAWDIPPCFTPVLLLSRSSAYGALRICCFWHGPCGGKQDHCNFLQSKLRTGNLGRLFGRRFWSTFSTRNCRFFSFVSPVVYCSFFLFPPQAVFGTERGLHASDPGYLHPYGLFAHAVSGYLIRSTLWRVWLQRGFAVIFAGLGAKLVFSES